MDFLPNIPLDNSIDVPDGASYVFHIPLKKKNSK
jgi:hypothetical protein